MQNLLKKVRVHTQAQVGHKALQVLDTYTARYPEEMPAKVTIHLNDGRELVCEKRTYEGFHATPMPREHIIEKFESMAAPYTDASLRQQIISAVDNLDDLQVLDLTQLLGKVQNVPRESNA